MTELDYSDLKRIQERLVSRVKIKPLKSGIRYVAGLDCAVTKDKIVGEAVLMSYPELQMEEEKFSFRELSFPYVPGFLSFREMPALISAYLKLSRKPDMIIVDGQGILHPRGMGLASHLGVILNKPSIGCAKSLLCGEYEEPSFRRGSKSPVFLNEKIMGYALRTRDGVKPVIVSPGHLITPLQAQKLVLEMSFFRLPEPVRLADKYSRENKKYSSQNSKVLVENNDF
ncbi:endonuclease V [candidate division WOR-3 bacterium]|nr:endonuclease V [candidate division WOR-3 bacterium]